MLTILPYVACAHASMRVQARGASYGSTIRPVGAPFQDVSGAFPKRLGVLLMLLLYRRRKLFGATLGDECVSYAPRRDGGSMMRGRRHGQRSGKQALASVPPHWTTTADAAAADPAQRGGG